MRNHSKLACGALTVNLISGLLGLCYLIALGVKQLEPAAFPLLGILAAVMAVSTLVMILALPKKK